MKTYVLKELKPGVEINWAAYAKACLTCFAVGVVIGLILI